MSPMGTKIYRDTICRTVYNLIRLQGETTRQFLADTTKLAPTSLNRVLDRLLEAGWITESGLASSTGGRRANLYSQNTLDKVFLVIRLDVSSARLGLFDPALKMLFQEEIASLCLEPALSPDSTKETTSIETVDKLPDEEEAFGLWLKKFKTGLKKLLATIPEDRALSPVYALIQENCGLSVDQLADITQAIERSSSNNKLSCMNQEIADCMAYGALWNPVSGKLGEATIVLIANLANSFICQAGDGLRHADGLRTLAADDLIVPLLQGDKPLTLAKAGQADGLLKQFKRIKQNDNLVWQDLMDAAATGKKKAMQTISIAAAAYASTILNSAALTQADHWILSGQMTEELPGLVAETEKQLAALMKKSDAKMLRLDASAGTDQLVWQGAAARLLEEQLILLD